MKKYLQFFLIFIFLKGHAEEMVKNPSKSLLILNMKNSAELPKEFRTTRDSFITLPNSSLMPTREGFDDLNISGSGQFSELSLKALLDKQNHPENFYLLDLRQENHGFINGDAVSWYEIKDWANVGKTLSQINKQEQKLFNVILKQRKIPVAVKFLKDFTGKSLPEAEMAMYEISSVAVEKQISKPLKINYIRIPVTDHVSPTDDNVDRFIDFVKALPRNYWIHMHCSAGIGRTSTFMVMFDIMKNSKKIPLDTILLRQVLIGGRDLRKSSFCSWKAAYNQERIRFIEEFYEYCRDNQDRFESSWSLYKLLKRGITSKSDSNKDCNSDNSIRIEK